MLRGGLFTRYFLEEGVRTLPHYSGIGIGEAPGITLPQSAPRHPRRQSAGQKLEKNVP
jgi:hypothetical protein